MINREEQENPNHLVLRRRIKTHQTKRIIKYRQKPRKNNRNMPKSQITLQDVGHVIRPNATEQT
eukprot:9061151-Karenia_brevis.AAC.1